LNGLVEEIYVGEPNGFFNSWQKSYMA